MLGSRYQMRRVQINSLRRALEKAGYFDIKVIDRFGPNGFAHLTRGISWCICRLQTGYIVNYVLYIVFALVLCITIFVFRYLPVAWSA